MTISILMIISSIFIKISFRNLQMKTASHSRLSLGLPNGINMVSVLSRQLRIIEIKILRLFLLCTLFFLFDCNRDNNVYDDDFDDDVDCAL